jgi:hypothetical protein
MCQEAHYTSVYRIHQHQSIKLTSQLCSNKSDSSLADDLLFQCCMYLLPAPRCLLYSQYVLRGEVPYCIDTAFVDRHDRLFRRRTLEQEGHIAYFYYE